MDWNMKADSCDFGGFQREGIVNIDADSGSSGLGGRQDKGNFSVDLKLGQVVVDSGSDFVGSVKVPTISMPELSNSKRARATTNGIQMVSCLVDGCTADLSNCRDYHRRHKVCEAHSKTPVVTIGGHKKRFCQQCSRFHSLEEFDEGKRSCRKRLEGHNRRRRKPQPETLSQSGSFISSYHQGTRLPFSSPPTYAGTNVANSIWVGGVKHEEDNNHSHWNAPDKQNPFHGSCSTSDVDEGKNLVFLHGTNLSLSSQTAPKSSVYQPLVDATLESGNCKMFYDGLTSRGVHSDCALSLLSSSSSSSSMQPSGFNLSYMAHHQQQQQQQQQQRSPISTGHSLGPELHCNNLDSVDSIHCQGGLFHPGTEASPDNETPQTLPFYWE